jgi:NADPH:quinone reductase-like Zn-dependent oxidoreductase
MCWWLTNNDSNKYRKAEGAFATYAVARDLVQSKIPDNMSFEEAATQGVALATIVSLSLRYGD